MKKQSAFLFVASLAVMVLASGEARAQDLCEAQLSGKSYTCSITSVDSPTGISTVTMSFENASWPGVETSFQMTYGGTIPFACACLPSGKPGKLKTPEKSTAFACIKSWSDGYGNNVSIDGRVSGGGSKIVKGRWLSNVLGTDSYVFSCVAD